MRIPTDSTDARELRELDEHHAEVDLETEELHASVCTEGWLGEDDAGRPVPCPTCRPLAWPRPCPLCATPAALCVRLVERRRRRCCASCEHPPLPTWDQILRRCEDGGDAP